MTFREMYLYRDDIRSVWMHPNRADDGSIIIDVTVKPNCSSYIDVTDIETDTLKIVLNKQDVFFSDEDCNSSNYNCY